MIKSAQPFYIACMLSVEKSSNGAENLLYRASLAWQELLEFVQKHDPGLYYITIESTTPLIDEETLVCTDDQLEIHLTMNIDGLPICERISVQYIQDIYDSIKNQTQPAESSFKSGSDNLLVNHFDSIQDGISANMEFIYKQNPPSTQ